MKKTRHGDYEKVVCFPVWSDYYVHAIFSDDIAEARTARYGSSGIIDKQTGALHSCTEDGHSHLFYKFGASAEVITHEAFHAIWRMFNWAGVDKWDNETTAYHLGYLVGQISLFQAKVLAVKSSTKKR